MDAFRLAELDGTAGVIEHVLRGKAVTLRAVPAAVTLAVEAAIVGPRPPTRLKEVQGSLGKETELDYADPAYTEASFATTTRRSAAIAAWALNMPVAMPGKGELAPPGLGEALRGSEAAAYFVLAGEAVTAALTLAEIDGLIGAVRRFGLVARAEQAAKN